MLHFANTWLLLLLWPVLGLGLGWFLSIRRASARLASFVSAAMQPKLCPRETRLRSLWQAALITTGLALAVIAMARPQWGEKEVRIFQRGRDLVIALDVSTSMLAGDVHPNRLERAKADIMDLIHDLNGDRAALLAFRNKSVLVCPLTMDYAFLKLTLDTVSIDSAPRGATNIGDAIRKALAALDSESSAHKAILLISDGEDLEGQALDAAREAREVGIPIFTVGIGHPGGTRIPGHNTDQSFITFEGKEVVTRLDNQALNAIADASNGRYIAIQTASTANVTLGTLYNEHLRKISKQDYEATVARRRIERYPFFLLPAIILFLAASTLSRGRLAAGKRSAVSVQRSTLMILILACLATTASASTNIPSPPNTQAPKYPGTHAPSPTRPLALSPSPSSPRTLNTELQTPNSPSQNPNSPSPTRPHPPSPRRLAWDAQKQFDSEQYEAAAQLYLKAADLASPVSRQTYTYNAGIALYLAGHHQDAADLLHDLTATTADPDLLMAYGSALYHAAALTDEPNATNLAHRAETLRRAGESFMAAARGQRNNETAKRNLATILQQLPAAQQEAKIAALMSEHGGKPSAEIARDLLRGQREVLQEIVSAYSDKTPNRIHTLEGAAAKQDAARDLWIPLRSKLMNDMAIQLQGQDQQQKLAELNHLIEATQDNMAQSSEYLRDLDPESYDFALKSEGALYQFWKGIAPYMPVLKEDLYRQTNALAMNRSRNDPNAQRVVTQEDEQREALGLTRLFKERFSHAVPETPPPGVTNQQVSAETRAEVLLLTDKVIEAQEKASRAIAGKQLDEALFQQNGAHELLKKIEKLLAQDQPEQQPQEQPQQPPPEQPPPEQPPPEQPPPEQPPPEDNSANEDVQRMLEKALQREREHEAEKRKRIRVLPLSPNERDW